MDTILRQGCTIFLIKTISRYCKSLITGIKVINVHMLQSMGHAIFTYLISEIFPYILITVIMVVFKTLSRSRGYSQKEIFMFFHVVQNIVQKSFGPIQLEIHLRNQAYINFSRSQTGLHANKTSVFTIQFYNGDTVFFALSHCTGRMDGLYGNLNLRLEAKRWI